jgi:hypothetical protein
MQNFPTWKEDYSTYFDLKVLNALSFLNIIMIDACDKAKGRNQAGDGNAKLPQ